MTPADIIAAARAAIGTPFRHQGRSVGRALDCAGLVIHVVRTLEIDHQDRTDYPRRPHNNELQAQLDLQDNLEKVSGPPQAGDILLMRFGREPQHLSVFTGFNHYPFMAAGREGVRTHPRPDLEGADCRHLPLQGVER